MKRPAPIAVFVHRRPEHARRLLLSLLANRQVSESAISIFCDGARSDQEKPDVERARTVVRELAPKHARIVERSENLGLANSVITGVSELVEAHGEVIVLEDDLELSPFVLEYLNAALERFRDEERVMHVSAYMYPVKATLPEAFFYREATCWGWATWARAWRHFEPDADRIRGAVLERRARRAFDVEGTIHFFEMLEAQLSGQIDSWAVRWYGSLWLRGGLALHPGRSLVRNTGFDGSGVHSPTSTKFAVDLAQAAVNRFPSAIEEDAAAVQAMIAYRRVPAWSRGLAQLSSALRKWRR